MEVEKASFQSEVRFRSVLTVETLGERWKEFKEENVSQRMIAIIVELGHSCLPA